MEEREIGGNLESTFLKHIFFEDDLVSFTYNGEHIKYPELACLRKRESKERSSKLGWSITTTKTDALVLIQGPDAGKSFAYEANGMGRSKQYRFRKDKNHTAHNQPGIAVINDIFQGHLELWEGVDLKSESPMNEEYILSKFLSYWYDNTNQFGLLDQLKSMKIEALSDSNKLKRVGITPIEAEIIVDSFGLKFNEKGEYIGIKDDFLLWWFYYVSSNFTDIKSLQFLQKERLIRDQDTKIWKNEKEWSQESGLPTTLIKPFKNSIGQWRLFHIKNKNHKSKWIMKYLNINESHKQKKMIWCCDNEGQIVSVIINMKKIMQQLGYIP